MEMTPMLNFDLLINRNADDFEEKLTEFLETRGHLQNLDYYGKLNVIDEARNGLRDLYFKIISPKKSDDDVLKFAQDIIPRSEFNKILNFRKFKLDEIKKERTDALAFARKHIKRILPPYGPVRVSFYFEILKNCFDDDKIKNVSKLAQLAIHRFTGHNLYYILSRRLLNFQKYQETIQNDMERYFPTVKEFLPSEVDKNLSDFDVFELALKNCDKILRDSAHYFKMTCDEIVTFRGIVLQKGFDGYEQFRIVPGQFLSTSVSVDSSFCSFAAQKAGSRDQNPYPSLVFVEFIIKKTASVILAHQYGRAHGAEQEVIITPDNKFKKIGEFLNGGWYYIIQLIKQKKQEYTKPYESFCSGIEYTSDDGEEFSDDNLLIDPRLADYTIDYYRFEVYN